MRYLLLFLLCITRSSFAENFPDWDVYWMCADADAIILGEQLQDDRVKVTKWIKGVPDSEPATIVITDIHKLSKSLGARWERVYKKQPDKTLTSRRFVAFLEHKDKVWKSMVTIEDSGLCGSCGMVWIEKGRCYRYLQTDNPGPYELYEAKDTRTENELLEAIKTGLRDVEEWQKTLNISDPALRSQGLVQYALLSTSPEAPRETYRFRVREPLRSLGQIAVPALRAQIRKWCQGDSLDEVVLILNDLGQGAREAVPDLILLLKQPERAHPYYVLSALRTTGDSSNIDDIKPFLEHSDQQVRKEAETAIAALSKAKSP
jgi:hypothetical protein